jgi:glycosyltransferase involved in cell wall biosynthesis
MKNIQKIFEGLPRSERRKHLLQVLQQRDKVGTAKTGVVAMVKNEGDIIELFVSHVLALFDVVVIVDQMSNDGTLDLLENIEQLLPNFTVYKLNEPGYIQSITMNHVVKNAPELSGLDWVFLLDADEFLPFIDKESFLAGLAPYDGQEVISMNWYNVIPVEYWDYKVSINRQFYIPPFCSPYQKIAFQPHLLNDIDFWIEQGNHSISRWQGGDELPAVKSFDMWHLPIRSVNQLSIKLTQGVISYLKKGRSRSKLEGLHWFQMLEYFKGKPLQREELNGIVDAYSLLDAEFSPKSDEQLLEMGYVTDSLRIAQSDLPVQLEKPQNVASIILKAAGDLASRDDSEIDGRSITRLEIGDRRVLRRDSNDNGHVYEALNSSNEASSVWPDEGSSHVEFLNAFLRPSCMRIEDLTPTTWDGHVPFMFSLVDFMKPRIYVELGTQCGFNFFACCQAVKKFDRDVSCIAIDTWQDNIQAGSYADNGFDNFRHIIQKYDGIGRYIRASSDEAARMFEDGSIDLLCIDGLHTYEAVLHDYNTWLPKMSGRGAILLHDTNVYDRNFGVWQLWRNLEKQYPSIQFTHSRGLGLIYVGSEKNTLIEKFINILGNDEGLFAHVQWYLENMAQVNSELFQLKQDLKRLETKTEAFENKVMGIARDNEEVTMLRQKLHAVEVERNDLKVLLESHSRTVTVR